MCRNEMLCFITHILIYQKLKYFISDYEICCHQGNWSFQTVTELATQFYTDKVNSDFDVWFTIESLMLHKHL